MQPQMILYMLDMSSSFQAAWIRFGNHKMSATSTTRFITPVLTVWLLCSCTSLPVIEKNAGIDQIPDLQITNLVLTRRVVLEPGQGERRRYVSQKIVSVTPTSNFGKANEIANLDCVVTGLHEVLHNSAIVTPAEFWGTIGDNIETLELTEIFEEHYSHVIGGLNIDYLIVAFHQLIDKYNGFGEYIAFGGVDDIDLEIASAVTVDMDTERIIDATEIAGAYRSMFMHFSYVPVYIHAKREDDPCLMAGRDAAAVISRTYDKNTVPRIAVVAAMTNPYTEVTGIENEYLPIGGKQNLASERERACAGVECRTERGNTVGIIKEAGIYCPNADLGHADARLHIGDIYHYGEYGSRLDPVRAWVWYSLADRSGEPKAAEKLSRITTGLSPKQLEEAKQELTTWEPGQCMQDLATDQKGQDVE